MITPDKHYRLNPSRAIYVTGEINDDIVARLTPRILALQSQSRDPICVYINSPGGSPRSAEILLDLLNLSDQDQSDACWIITAVPIRAASAAADLLASGDYSIAFANSTILHHGVRSFDDSPLTFESTSRFNEMLRISNTLYAMKLAQKIDRRFTFRFLTLRSDFPALREKLGKPDFTDFECFTKILREKLSKAAEKVLDKALKRNERYETLINSVVEKTGDVWAKSKDQLEVQVYILKAILDLEVSEASTTGMKDFRFSGMRRLVDDFYILNEYLTGSTDSRLDEWCQSLGKLCLTTAQEYEISLLPDEKDREKKTLELVKPILRPMLSLFVALCHALQEGENELTATDAFWLGLVDEVVGDEELWNLRLMHEFEPDPEPEKEGDASKEESVPAEETQEVPQAQGA